MSESPKNIIALIAALENFKNSNRNFKTDDRELFDESRDVFQRLKRLSDFDPDNLEKIIDFLDDLPLEIKELDISEIGYESEKMESKSLNKEDLKELIEDYEKTQNKEIKEELHEEIVKRTGKRNVDQFIKTQKEIAAKNAEKLKQLSPELREKVTLDLAKIRDEDHEAIATVLEKAILDDKYNKKELEKEIKKVFKEEEEKERIVKKVEEIRAEIKVESKAEEIAQKTYEKLKEEGLPVSEKVKNELKENILESFKERHELVLPKEIEGKTQAETITREARVATDNFKKDEFISIVNYRAIELEKELGQELRNNGVRDEKLITEYVSVVNELTNNPNTARLEVNDNEVVTFVEGRYNEGHKFLLQPEIATEEAQFMARNMVVAPKKFNNAVRRYNELRDLVGAEKLPKIREIRVMEKMTSMFVKNPRVLGMMNNMQRMVGFLDKIDNFPENLAIRFFTSEQGLQIVGKIGGQATAAFVKNSAAIIAERGTLEGVKQIALSLFSKGAVVAGEAGAGGAAAGGAAAGGAAVAGLSATGVGLIIAAVIAVVTVGTKIFSKFKDWLKKNLDINLGAAGDFFSDTLGFGKAGKFVGGLVLAAGAFLINLPMYLLGSMGILAPVIIFFFLGLFSYSLFQGNLVSSLVPPEPIGGGNCVLKEVAESSGGTINCNQNAPENNVSGISRANFVRIAGMWKTGKNYSEECYNDTVNRALCAGINPAYALWAWVHESGASNYSIKDVEDFGIHFIPENKNYNAQITAFLKLDPGTACPQLGYWLSFATNYLTGECDPDVKIPSTGESGRDYLLQIQEQWSWISSSPMPANIRVPKGGKSCGSSGGDTTDTPNTSEYTDENGDVWICYGPEGNDDANVPNFEPWDTSIPVPEGCPSMRPTNGYFTQGPFASGCSHQNMSVPAVDFGAGNGTPIVATHPGVAVLNHDSIYGYYIDVHGKCQGKDFYTRYAHMPSGGYKVGNNVQVKAGQQIGVVDDTGSSTGPHLHYHISGLDSSKFGQYLGLSVEDAKKLWGCCGSWNGKMCP